MNYIYVENNIAREIVPEYDLAFPGIPVEERYSEEFVSQLIADDSGDVNVGWIYDPETKEFSAPPPPEPIPQNIEEAKIAKINDSKVKLAEWLETNPMTYSDGKRYTVTEEKQSLLNSNLASYERATQAGIPYPLKWNATGEKCTEWEYPALVGLSLAMASYVASRVSKQQAIEIEINACEAIEQVEAVVIDYE